MNKQLNKQGFVRFWLIQLGLLFIIMLISGLGYDIKAAYSAFLGGLVGIIPNALFAIKLFKHQGAKAARQIVNSFYKGEAFKIILSIVLFALVFRLCKITPVAFFASYILVLMTQWLAPWIIVNKHNRLKSD